MSYPVSELREQAEALFLETQSLHPLSEEVALSSDATRQLIHD